LLRRSFGGDPGTVDCFEAILGLIVWEELQASSSFVIFGVKHYGRDTALEECGDGFDCGHQVGWFTVVRGGAASL
jgi:hypothetical protein